MIRGIHHFSLTTQNMDRMVDFYTRLLGFEVVWDHHIHDSAEVDAVVGCQNADMRTAMLRTGNCYVELFEYLNPPAVAAPNQDVFGCGYRHFALDVVDIEEEYERLLNAGVEFVSEPKPFVNLKGVYMYDPDGNVIEMQEILTDDFPFHIQRAGALLANAKHDYQAAHVREQGEILKSVLSGHIKP
jgi:glyoxylase I family protein